MRYFYTILFLSFFIGIIAQNDTIFEVSQTRDLNNEENIRNSLNRRFSNYKLLSVNMEELYHYLNNRSGVTFTLNLEGLEKQKMSLQAENVKANDYRLITSVESGSRAVPHRENITFQGTSNGVPVAITVSRDYFSAYFSNGNLSAYIEPLNTLIKDAPKGVYIYYETKDIKKIPTVTCGLQETNTEIQKLQRVQSQMDKKNVVESDTRGCVTVRLAIATTYDMLLKANNSVSELEAKITSMINNVNLNYANAFNKKIKFDIVAMNIAETSASSLDVALQGLTDADDILGAFRRWSNKGNLTNNFYDLGTLITNRDFDGSTIGLAYLGALSSDPDHRYNIIQYKYNDFTQVTISHEIGHNFGCTHTTGIMSALAQITDVWDPASVNSVNKKEASLPCNEGTYALRGSATANFELKNTACRKEVVVLKGHNSRGTTSWNWVSSDGSPTNTETQNSSISFADAGTKSVSLTVSNGTTCDGSIVPNTQTKEIEVIDQIAPAPVKCTTDYSSGYVLDHFTQSGIVNFKFGTIDRSSEDVYYDKKILDDQVCSHFTKVNVGQSYPLEIKIYSAQNQVSSSVWIDFNNDGEFSNTTERVFYVANDWSGVHSGTVSIPTNGVTTNTLLRMRVMSHLGWLSKSKDACYRPMGQVEDYGVIIEDESTGVSPEKALAQNIALSPSRFDNEVILKIPLELAETKIKVHVYDIVGNWIASQTVLRNAGEIVIPSGEWARGVYLFVVETENELLTNFKGTKY